MPKNWRAIRLHIKYLDISKVFIPYICSQAVNIQTIDGVWDRHLRYSLSRKTRNNWGAGARINIFRNGKVINKQTIFICCSNYKSELFPLLSTQLLSEAAYNKTVAATDTKMVVLNHHSYLNDMCPVTQERQMCLLLRALGVSKSFDRILRKTVVSHIVITATATFRKISSMKELWIEFGIGNSLTWF